jgi:hypothetical protein
MHVENMINDERKIFEADSKPKNGTLEEARYTEGEKKISQEHGEILTLLGMVSYPTYLSLPYQFN